MKKLTVHQLVEILHKTKERLWKNENFYDILPNIAEESQSLGYDWANWNKNLFTFCDKVSKGQLGIEVPYFENKLRFRITGIRYDEGFFYATYIDHDRIELETSFELDQLIRFGDDDRHFVVWVGYYHFGEYPEMEIPHATQKVFVEPNGVQKEVEHLMWKALRHDIKVMVQISHHPDYDRYIVWLDKGQFQQR